MKTTLLILLVIGLVWFLGSQIWQAKEYKLWNKIATRKDKIMDVVFMLGMGLILGGIFYLVCYRPIIRSKAAASKQQVTSQRQEAVHSSTSQRRYEPPRQAVPNQPARRFSRN